MKKLLYIFLDETKSPGVHKKVRSKIAKLNELGVSTKGIFLNTKIDKTHFNAEEKIQFIKLEVKPLPFIYNRRYFRDYKWLVQRNRYDKTKYDLLASTIDNEDFDYILMRYPLGSKGLLNFVKKYKNKIVFEHNSKELVELGLSKDKNKTLDKILQDEKVFGPKVIQNALGVTGVGNEVTEYELSRVPGTKIRSLVVPNGIDVESIPVRSIPQLTSTYNLLFLTGSPSPWVGVDMVIQSLASYSLKEKVKLFIVGPINDDLQKLSNNLNLTDQVVFTGQKTTEELSEYFDQCQIAFATMAMHKVGLSEHSSLKACEYAARGIPFVIGYDDTNFYQNDPMKPYFHKMNTLNGAFDFSEVIDFADSVMQIENHALKMHNEALKSLDFSVQMQKVVDFFNDL